MSTFEVISLAGVAFLIIVGVLRKLRQQKQDRELEREKGRPHSRQMNKTEY